MVSVCLEYYCSKNLKEESDLFNFVIKSVGVMFLSVSYATFIISEC
jgi:hypothetical protein